jgi:hypothetical protein
LARVNDSLGPLIALNPFASPGILADALSDYVEVCVSEALRSLPIAPASIPSPAQAKLQSMMRLRRRKRSRLVLEDLSARESFLTELYYLRSRLDGGPRQGTMTTRFRGIIDGPGTERFADIRTSPADIFDGEPSPGMKGTTGHIPDVRPSVQPYTKSFGLAEELPVVRLVMEPLFSDLIASDLVFERVAKAVESNLRAIAVDSQVPMKLNFSVRTDPEYPHWMRYVVTIDSSVDFDSRMKFWSEVDSKVRDAIAELCDRKPSDSARIREISKNLFIHMELS